MTVTALCLETGVFGGRFVQELAATLGVDIIDLRPLELGIAEWHLFSNNAAADVDPGGASSFGEAVADIEERTVRMAVSLVQAAKSDLLVVGWSAAAVLASLNPVTRVCIRAPRTQTSWNIVRHFRHQMPPTIPPAGDRRESHLSWFLNRASGPKWLNPADFDLILDSGSVSAADSQREIIALVKRHRHLRSAAHAREQHSESPTWQSLKGCAVSVGGDDLPLAGIESQEAAIAKVEQHLHGPSVTSTPVNPLCGKVFD